MKLFLVLCELMYNIFNTLQIFNANLISKTNKQRYLSWQYENWILALLNHEEKQILIEAEL